MEEIADRVYAGTTYAGINVGAVLTRKGLICIDTPSYPRDARDWVSRLHHIDPRPIRFLILTNAHGDRIVNTRWLNARIIAHQKTAAKLKQYEKRYPQPLIDSLVTRNYEAGRELSNGPVEKVSISFDSSITLLPNGFEIQLHHFPGPDAGNIGVYIPSVNVLFTGDAIVSETHPLISQSTSGMWLQTIEKLRQKPFSKSAIVPGRGAIKTTAQITEIEAYITEMRQAVEQYQTERRPKNELFTLATTFLPKFPLRQLPRDWVSAQIRSSLEFVYDELVEDRDEQRLH